MQYFSHNIGYIVVWCSLFCCFLTGLLHCVHCTRLKYPTYYCYFNIITSWSVVADVLYSSMHILLLFGIAINDFVKDLDQYSDFCIIVKYIEHIQFDCVLFGSSNVACAMIITISFCCRLKCLIIVNTKHAISSSNTWLTTEH